MVVVLPLLRGDYIRSFENGSGTQTPNLDHLTYQSLSFTRAIPECMPALPVRRTLLTGVRSFPFRDWTRTDGLPAVPGYNPARDVQPVLTETVALNGIRSVYITDNPMVAGPRFGEVRRPPGRTPGINALCPCGSGRNRKSCCAAGSGIKDEIAAIERASAAVERTFRAGIDALRELRGKDPYFLGVDPFDPVDATEAPPIYVTPHRVDQQGIGPMDGRLVEMKFKNGDLGPLRDAYRKHVELVDDWVGRLMDEVPDDLFLMTLADTGIALGEHESIGRGTPTSHRLSYEIPYLIRHPGGQHRGDSVHWYASTHDVAPTLLSAMGLVIPGKMRGEDLTQLYDGVDDADLPARPFSITCSGSLIVVRDSRWLMVSDREQLERRLYDDDEEADDDNKKKRYDDVAGDAPGQLTDMSMAAITVAGGTLPEFGPDGALRPTRERGNDDVDNDGIPNDWDAVDNEHPDDYDTPEGIEFDGRDPQNRQKIVKKVPLP
jgi:arylsulfatase A-like enzyme